MMANMSEKDQKTLRLGMIGAALILVVVFVVFPIMDAWEDLGTRIETAQKELTEIESGVRDAANASIEGQRLQKKATIYPTRAALNQQTAAMLQKVESLPGYDELAVRRLEGLPLRDEDSYARSAVSMQFSGTLRDLHQFVEAVENSEPALKVDRLTITRDSEDSSKITGQVVIAGYAVVTEKRKRG